MANHRIPLEDFDTTFPATTELSSVALGGQIRSVSDEFFAKAYHLLLVEPPPSLKGQFGPNGALYSGWESRRHNPGHDWCIVKLGSAGIIHGFDIDTTHFNGNEAPQASVSALYDPDGDPQVDDERWVELLSTVDLDPNSRHLFKIGESFCTTHVRLNIYPDGGVARFRVYGFVRPVFPEDPSTSFDLASVMCGGHVLFTSDQHFGKGSNLILPGRGEDMGDGWETRRSRQKDHSDWAIIKLGIPGSLEMSEIDTAHFMGNFPESCELHATAAAVVDKDQFNVEWTPILSRRKLHPNRRHFSTLENVQGRVFTHVKLTVYPDGGVKRVRIIGRRADEEPSTILMRVIPVLPLTYQAFEPFGQVIEAYSDNSTAPQGTRITSANQRTATKFHNLAPIWSSYLANAGATTGLSVYRCKPLQVINSDGTFDIKLLERHRFTNQAFIPMGGGGGTDGDGLDDPGTSYLVVVAKNDWNGLPDTTTLTAFIATGAQGIMYNTAVWHQPMTCLGKPMDFTCVETQIGNGDPADCEVFELDTQGVFKLQIPYCS